MYDSRSSHPRNRGSRWDRHWSDDRKAATKALERTLIEEGLVVAIQADEPAVTRSDIDRLHTEALRMHHAWLDEQEEAEAYLTHQLFGGNEVVALWEWKLLTGQDDEHRYDTYVGEFKALLADRDEYAEQDQLAHWDDEEQPNGYTHDDCWLPYASVEQCRDIFNGTDFTIQHTNVVRRRTA